MAKIEGIQKVRTRRVTGPILNKVIDQANRADRLRVGPGLLVGEDSLGRTLSLEDLPQFTKNPATLARVVNIGDETIPTYGVMGMVESFHKKHGVFQHERAISVRKPTTEDAGRLAIAVDEIPPKQVGLACIDGVCIVNIVRWFNFSLLNKASLHAGQFYALADAQGELDILWEETDYIGEEEHLALVRFKRDFVPLKYKNVGTKEIPIFNAVVKLTYSSGIASGLYAGASPPDAVFMCRPSYINLGGSVAVGGYGTMMVGMPGVIEWSSTVGGTLYAGNPVGPRSDTVTFDIDKSGGYAAMADLGTRNSKNYAVVFYDGAVWA